MNVRGASIAILGVALALPLAAQETKPATPRHISLDEAVQLALKHNHVVRLATFQVEESEKSKEAARSAYFPTLRNDSNFAHVTDTQFIAIQQGSLGTVDGTPIPTRTPVLNQGGHTFATSGTQLTQPLAELWKVRSANDVAAADTKVARSKAQQMENEVALRVHQIYYQVLILQAHHEAAQAKIRAVEDLQNERVEQVKYGAALENESIEARAEALNAKQDLLTTELQLSDLTIKLDDAIGLPLTTQLVLDPAVGQAGESCEREECLRMALESHPEIVEAHAEVEKASAAVRLAKREYLPNVDAFARYSYQDNVPFLARNFGTFGIHFGYDLFDGGKRNAEIGERKAQLAQADENLARVKDEIELRVQTAYNKVERTREMLNVSRELLALRTEMLRVSVQQMQEGTALRSQVDSATAQELDAKTSLLQSQLDYLQAQDEMMEAVGRTPE
jgi:outer membrane protein TolC